MNTLECNKLISEYMGIKHHEEQSLLTGIGNFYLVDEHRNALNFHEDYNLLMQVVEKIESEDYGIKMCRKVCEVYVDSTKKVVLNIKEATRKQSLYKAIVILLGMKKMN